MEKHLPSLFRVLVLLDEAGNLTPEEAVKKRFFEVLQEEVNKALLEIGDELRGETQDRIDDINAELAGLNDNDVGDLTRKVQLLRERAGWQMTNRLSDFQQKRDVNNLEDLMPFLGGIEEDTATLLAGLQGVEAKLQQLQPLPPAGQALLQAVRAEIKVMIPANAAVGAAHNIAPAVHAAVNLARVFDAVEKEEEVLISEDTRQYNETLKAKHPDFDAERTEPLNEWESSLVTDSSNPTRDNANILGRNMGLKDRDLRNELGIGGKEYTPHHIVESGRKTGDGLGAKELLDKYEIDINSPSNGVALKQLREHKQTGLHDKETREEVFNRLKDAERNGSNWGEKRAKIIQPLDDIKTDILNNRFPTHRRG